MSADIHKSEGTALVAQLRAGCETLLGEAPPQTVCARMIEYLNLLARWNRTYNLSAVRDTKDMISRHVLDSLSVLPWLNADSLLDAGTGAGLPGVPLAILRPALDVTLLDSAGKKVRFLRHVKRELQLANVRPVQERLETFRPQGKVACIVSRAFSHLEEFAAAARHLMGPESRLLAMKGRHPAKEIAGLPDWIRVDRVEQLFVPGLHEERHLVMMSLST